jgi:uncharacterized protein (UPF0332 family)
MDAWQLWQEMARESEKAARMAELGGCLRSSASRYYYAAYQMVTALLLYRGLTPPPLREAWSHFETPLLLKEQLAPLIRSRTQRNDMASRFGELYKLRITADYVGRDTLRADKLNGARKDASYLFKIADEILPER